MYLGVAFPISADTIDTITRASGSDHTNVVLSDSGTAAGFRIYQWSQKYTPGASHNVCTITVNAKATATGANAPTDSVRLDITIGSSTSPWSLPLVATADSQWQIRGTTPADYTFTFTPCAVVVGANAYNFNLVRSVTAGDPGGYGFNSCPYSSCVFTGTGSWGVIQSESPAGVAQQYFGTSPRFTVNAVGTENFGAIAPSTTPQFAQSIINTILGLNDDNATSTLTGAAGGWTNIPSYFARKVPWGYLFDIASVYDDIATSSSEFSEVAFDFSDSRISTSTRSWLPGRIVVFSTSTVTYYFNGSALAAANTLLAAAGWVMVLMYWYRRGIKT